MNSAVLGAFVGLVVARFGGASLIWAATAGVAAFAVSVGLHLRKERSLFTAMEELFDGSNAPTDR